MTSTLGTASERELLEELQLRGGASSALAEAGLLCLSKSEDYNRQPSPKKDERDSYFPFGLMSYTQLIHTKSQRLVSLCLQDSVNFESAKDTCLDLINYASFCADWLQRTAE